MLRFGVTREESIQQSAVSIQLLNETAPRNRTNTLGGIFPSSAVAHISSNETTTEAETLCWPAAVDTSSRVDLLGRMPAIKLASIPSEPYEYSGTSSIICALPICWPRALAMASAVSWAAFMARVFAEVAGFIVDGVRCGCFAVRRRKAYY